MRTHDENIGYRIIRAFYNNNNQPECIGFRKVRFRTGYSNDAITYWLNLLQKYNLIGKIESENLRDRKYYLTTLAKAKNKLEILEMLVDSRRKKRNRQDAHDSNITAKKQKRRPSKREKEETIKHKIKFHILNLAASGVTFETVLSENRKLHTKPITVTPSTTTTELLLNQVIASSPFTQVNDILLDTVKGVAVEDFFSKHTLSLIMYCHLHELGLKRSEVKGCVKELVNQGILKAVYNTKRQKNRYQIADPLLQKFIYYDHNDLFCLIDYHRKGQSDLSSILGNLVKKMRLEWHSRDPTRKEANWYAFLTSDQTKNTSLSCYAEIKKTLDGKQYDKDLDNMIFLTHINREIPMTKGIEKDDFEIEKEAEIRKFKKDDKQIKDLDIRINKSLKDIQNSSIDVKNKYPEIYKLMIENTYPEAMSNTP